MSKQFLSILFILATVFVVAQVGQQDSILRANADSYINRVYGSTFVRKHLEFRCIRGAGISAAFYELKAKPRPDGRNTILVYFKYESQEVDTTRKIFSKQEILQGTKKKSSCSLFIGEDKALEIAKNAGLSEQEQPWKISAHNFGGHQVPVWGITSTKYDNPDGHGSGSWMNIKMSDGSTETGLWSSMP